LTVNEQAREILSVSVAAQRTAHEIYDRYKNIYVAVSGGCDSEFVANSFLRAGVPFTPIMFTCENYLKLSEWYVDKWAQDNELEVVKFELSFIDYMQQAHARAESARAICAMAVTPSIVADEVKRRGVYLVTGSMPAYWPDPKIRLYQVEPDTDFRGFYIDEADYYIEMLDPNYHPWSFAYWSPEMLAAIVNAWDTSMPVEDNKWRIFDLMPRPKMNGSEVIQGNTAANHCKEYRDQVEWSWSGKRFGSRDFFQLPDKEQLLDLLVE
jgi:hypothetical protein